jgi:predicted transposase YbfD/YdcC
MDVDLPSASSLIVIERKRTIDDNEEPEVSFYISSMPTHRECAQDFGNLARGHWGGSEIRNHWVRDACMREDKTRSKNHKLNCALSALRVCLIALKTQFYTDKSWPSLQEQSQYDPGIPFNLISNHRAK